jgi:hypothetical protein
MIKAMIEADFVALPSGEPLAADGLRSVTARDQTTVVLLAGPVASGKTTIIVSLYELFNQGPVGGLLFGGSATLAGFERVCHAGREVSGSSVPDTIRTNPASGAAFLHLRVADVSTGMPRPSSLLISDVTGEAFEDARDAAEPTVIHRPLWRRANVICLVLDGHRLSNIAKRQVVRTEARSLLRAARDSKLMVGNCRLSVVTTKWDLVTTVDTENFIVETESQLKDQYAGDFASVTLHRIAARPVSNRVPYAYGVPALLTEWTSRPTPKAVIAKPPMAPAGGIGEFANAFWKQESGPLAEVFDAV